MSFSRTVFAPSRGNDGAYFCASAGDERRNNAAIDMITLRLPRLPIIPPVRVWLQFVHCLACSKCDLQNIHVNEFLELPLKLALPNYLKRKLNLPRAG